MDPGPPFRRPHRRAWILPLVLLIALCLPKIPDDRWEGDAGWYAAIARHALHEGHWWTLRSADRPYFNKPPLGFWVHGAFLKALGAEPWAARLPTVLAAAGAVVLTVAIARQLFGHTAALISGAILAGTVGFAGLADRLRLDFLLLALMLATVWCTVSGVARPRGWLIALGGIPLGLALLVKPLVALVALPILAAWLVVAGRGRLIPWLGLGAAVAVAVAAPWHLSMVALHGDAFTGEYFVRQSLDRGLSDRFGAEPWWWYLGHLARHYWPWLPAVALGVWSAAAGRIAPERRRGLALALLWAAVWLVALSLFADKRKQYLLPVYPALAWTAAVGLAAVMPPGWLRSVPRWTGRLTGAVLAVSVLWTVFAAPRTRETMPPEWRDLYRFVGASGADELWDGGLHYAHAGMVYINTGLWPRPCDPDGGEAARPPTGSLVVYDTTRTPPPLHEPVAFSSGRLVVTRAAGADVGHNRPDP